MKLFTFLSIMLFSTAIFVEAQIPNADFENWTNSSPNGWFTDNAAPILMPITETTDAQHGNTAVKGEVVLFQTVPMAPFMYAGIDSIGGFPVAERYASLIGYYKFTSVQDDSMFILVMLTKNGNLIGVSKVTPNPASSYTQFTANINYITNETPDSCRIVISILNQGPTMRAHVGSVMFIDNLSFGNVTAVNNQSVSPNSFELFQNYHNPFNPATNIKYNLSSSGFVTLTIYNLLGEKVKTLVNKARSIGTYEVTADLSRFTSGVYLYRINVTGENGKRFTSIKKMILLK